jgi:hypothetical protein
MMYMAQKGRARSHGLTRRISEAQRVPRLGLRPQAERGLGERRDAVTTGERIGRIRACPSIELGLLQGLGIELGIF